ncbi:DUF3781 domain-containing protein [Levilactobacillus lanxiensis]|uniref:DUF3781 domain-containing protein n=1 Tax=Levilactobacillus lanxiensis TaxID=2799568 RepID=A0ABW4D4K0_9LACO|nr:DUF3781 domain-containing protein [Levilactobacillus lanxiensis]
MTQLKAHVCYTELVYQRVNKKLSVDLSPVDVEALVFAVLDDDASRVEKLGKNYCVTNSARGVQLVINSINYRLITVNCAME